MSKPKHIPYVITSEGETASLRLIGEISWWQNNSQEFTAQVDSLLAAGVKNLNLYINTVGGSTFDAIEIANQLGRFTGTKTATIGAICASAGTVIACKMDKVNMMISGLYMVHDPAIEIRGTSEHLQSAIELLEQTRLIAIDIYEERTGLDKGELARMMKATTWMRASKAKELGFVDEIVTSITDAELLQVEATALPDKIEEKLKSGLCYMTALPPTPNNPQPQTMNKVKMLTLLMKAGIELPDTATEEQITAKLETLAETNVSLRASLAEMETKVAKEKATMLVDMAIANKQATESERAQLVLDATANYDLVKRTLDKIAPVAQASRGLGQSGDPEEVGISKMGFDELWKKHPEKVLKMKAEKPEEYARMYFKEFGVMPS